MSNGGSGTGEDFRIFMSYRRSDDPNFTGRFHDKLVNTFGESNVFRDIDSLAAGTRFADVITERIGQVDAVVALIGPSWVGRLESPTDFVRMEIAHALSARKPVIPVLIEDTPLPTVAGLPTELHSLLEINAVRVRRDPDFHRDAARVVAGIRESVLAGRELQAELVRQQAAAEAERSRQLEETRRADAERQAADERTRQAALRHQLEDELVRAETEEAERRRATEALEQERLERMLELARLEEEATRRQIADERMRIAALEETKKRRDEDLLAAETRSQELRALLSDPAPLAARATAEVIGRKLPPPQPIPPPPPPPVATRRDLAAPPDAAPKPPAARPARKWWMRTSPPYFLGTCCLVAATLVAVGALFIDGGYSGNALNGHAFSDVCAILLTVSLLAPLFARTAGVGAVMTTGVGVGYLLLQGAPNIYWFWGLQGGPVDAYPLAIVIIALLVLAARVLFGRNAPAERRRRTGRRGQIVPVLLAAAITVMTVIFVSRFHTEYRSNYDSSYQASPSVALPRISFLFLVPSVLLVIWSFRRTFSSAIARAALAGVATVVFVSATADKDNLTSRLARGEFAFAAVAAVVLAVLAIRTLRRSGPSVWSETPG